MLFWLGIIILMTHLLLSLDIVMGSRKIQFLQHIDPMQGEDLPSVAIIAAARNEERNIREALQSLLQLDYPHLQLIVVNDRSDDRTEAILSDMAVDEPRLEVVTISALPDGWLGKNHALYYGSETATGDLLLFTDADVVMAPDTLRRAVSYLQQDKIDHLAVTPEARMPTLFLNMFGAAFGVFFGMFTRPWKVSDTKSNCHVGIGAFNLVRSDVYRQLGGHKTIAMRPDDDLKLGKIIKKGGFKQQLAYGTGLISVEWYASVRELILGLEKNVFAGTDYRLWFAASGALFLLIANLWPYLALIMTEGGTLAVYAASVIIISLIVADGARLHGWSPWYALGFPLVTALFIFIIIRTVTCNLAKGGITWRGTFYPIDQLRKTESNHQELMTSAETAKQLTPRQMPLGPCPELRQLPSQYRERSPLLPR